MSDRLKLGLSASTSEIEAGIGEAETELKRLRARCRELQDLIALGRVTLLATRLNMSPAAPAVVRIPEAQPTATQRVVPPVPPAAIPPPPPMPAGPPPDPKELRQKLGRAAETRAAGPGHAVEAADTKPSRGKK